MSRSTPTRRRVALAGLVLVAAAAATAPVVVAAGDGGTATRASLAEARAKGAPGRELGLSQVTIPPGVTLVKHRHPGTQVATIVSGRLTYTVFVGAVEVYRTAADGSSALSRTVEPGTTAVLLPGDTVVEQPGDIHQGGNRGSKPVVITLATLFPDGAPSAIAVE